jgi:hypothetical protein
MMVFKQSACLQVEINSQKLKKESNINLQTSWKDITLQLDLFQTPYLSLQYTAEQIIPLPVTSKIEAMLRM